MKADLDTIRDTFEIGYNAYELSKREALEIWDQYHNRQYTADQLAVMSNRGQPSETFNVIKVFSRMLLGYYSTVVNTAVARPTKFETSTNAMLINDVLAYVLRTNNMIAQGDLVKLSAFMSGIMCVHLEVVPTGEKDRFGRALKEVKIEYIHDSEIVKDPQARKDDYSDGRYIHRFKWIPEESIIKLYGQKKLDQLDAYFNHLTVDEAEFEYSYNGEFRGRYRVFNNYLVVHSEIEDTDGKMWSVHWSGEVELFRKEVTKRAVKFSYRIVDLQQSHRTEHYGIFREIYQTQRAINQALIKVQLLINTQKAFVETGAVENIAEFTDAFNRVNAVIEVNDLNGVRVENTSKEVLDQYAIIDKAFDRIQRILGINDSFLGMAFASDSGRKVKLQQNASITALRYLTVRLEQFYRYLGQDVVELIKQSYTAEQELLITDQSTGDRWIQLNKPMEIFAGKTNPDGSPVMDVPFEMVTDPDTGKPATDEKGNFIVAPIPDETTEIANVKTNIDVSSAAYNDEDEKNQLMLETILSGNIGSLLSKVNPAGYFKAASLSIKTMKTKHSPDISEILDQTAQMLSGNPDAQAQASQIAQGNPGDATGSLSGQLKLPQNTNEVGSDLRSRVQ